MENYANNTSQNENKTPGAPVTKTLLIKMIWCLALSLFWVIFLWGISEREIYALGANAFVFALFTLALFFWVLKKKEYYHAKDLAWLIPLGLVSLSFLLYDNPFIKGVCIPVYPLLCALFFNYGFLSEKEKRSWDFNFISHFLPRLFSFIGKIGPAADYYLELVLPKSNDKKHVIKKIIIGVILFLAISLSVIVPLLSSADAEFSAGVKVFYGWFGNLISATLVYKIVVFFLLAMLLFSCLLAWGRRFDYEEKEPSPKKIDPVVSGIVIGGILGLYLLFLWVQVGRLWVGSLPFDFAATENLVKSGFWQLLFLSLVNIAIYFFTYRKTAEPVQKILAAFTVASLLLLVSAGERMGLYAAYYGLSYEKFFASYTVLYCGILFAWLAYRLFRQERANILKFLVFLFLWMFSLVAIFPVEQFIFRANIKLSALPDSRIRLFEMTMLSPDVLGVAKEYRERGLLGEKADYLEREGVLSTDQTFDWSPWIAKQEKILAGKKWYEKNMMNMLTK